MKISLKPNQKQNHTRVGRSLVGHSVPVLEHQLSANSRTSDSFMCLPMGEIAMGDARIMSILHRNSSSYVAAWTTTRQQNATDGFDHRLAPSCKKTWLNHKKQLTIKPWLRGFAYLGL